MWKTAKVQDFSANKPVLIDIPAKMQFIPWETTHFGKSCSQKLHFCRNLLLLRNEPDWFLYFHSIYAGQHSRAFAPLRLSDP
jgi:hypothetical protein